ncbi:hypothetical protein FKG94_13410 [Exilibacterium tricleocarpae]|uniref:Uncharacterized protein n=1 Tax=Exilibacterium tricleocarpae TaxID=2591008 RepID=A0A545TLH5_9GAMM|nr:hypothetical protein [Exilibacterium tricleocarpae]TQV78073.1 hypothetical protein FKG94_13410 [Exilibacterium tricleocarpae]
MKKFLAVRARTLFAAKSALISQGIEVVKANVERSEPALRNLVEGLHQRGLTYDIDGLGVFWLLVDSPHEPDYFTGFSAVECAFSELWLQQAAQKVRYLKGIAYCDATSAWADEFVIKDQSRSIEVNFERPPAFATAATTPVDSSAVAAGENARPGTSGAIVDLFGAPPPEQDGRKKSRAGKKTARAIEEEQLDMFCL